MQYNAAKPGEAAPAAGPFGPRGDWRTIDLASATDVAAAPTGHVKLLYEPVEGIERPQYGQHFSLSRIVDGRPQAVGSGAAPATRPTCRKATTFSRVATASPTALRL